MNQAQRALHAFRVVDGIINLFDVRRQFALQFAHAGRGRGGNNDFEVGRARFQRADELRANVHLADADGVDPEHVAIAERLFDFGIEPAEALAETAPPVAPPPHLQKVVRRGDTEKNRNQYVVKGSHGLVASLTNLSQKPAGLPRKIRRAWIFHKISSVSRCSSI